MKISFLATLTFIGAALAASEGKTKTIAIGQPCTKDGSMGICDKGGFCLQKKDAEKGVCKPGN